MLPFADLSRAHDKNTWPMALAEDILNQLAQSQSLRVVGRTSSFSFKGRNEDLRVIGSKLGVDHLLEGSVRRDGDQLRVTAQLIRTDDGTHLWSKTYARELRDVFAVQEEIARDVALALSVKLDVARFNREQGGTTNIEAYDRLLRWRSIMMRGQLDAEHDRERLQLARGMVALDPQCVLCRDLLARSLDSMARELGEARGGPLRAEAQQVRAEIARTAPDSWVGKLIRANALWREGRRAEAIDLSKAGRGCRATDQGAGLGLHLHALRDGPSGGSHRAGGTGPGERTHGAVPLARPAVRLHRHAPLRGRRGRIPARPRPGGQPAVAGFAGLLPPAGGQARRRHGGAARAACPPAAPVTGVRHAVLPRARRGAGRS
ncbi:hypothetical protein H1235_01605 [Pseudoxanthomonas sp. NC8]|nr:hypothetical protein H1235_01605 [Pseudoxanthomonas sp. NC8]